MTINDREECKAEMICLICYMNPKSLCIYNQHLTLWIKLDLFFTENCLYFLK